MDQHDVLLRYADAAAESSKRTRLVFLVMIVASVVAFSATWNSSQVGWLNSRLQVAEDVQRWWGYLARDTIPSELSTDALKQRYQQAKNYFAMRGLSGDSLDLQRIQADIALFREARVKEIMTIRIPFFGVSFDINDLSLIGGFAFSVIMLWFLFSIGGELRDTRITFMRAKEFGSLDTAYDLLLMRQVLTTPPSSTGSTHGWLVWIIRLLFALPAAVQFYIFSHDISTWNLGESLSPVLTRYSVIGGGIFLVIIVGLTIFCWYLSIQIDAEWKVYDREIRTSSSRT